MEESAMRGEERRRLEGRVWGDADDGGRIEEGERFEIEIEEGEGVFIPRGWWHSVKGVGGGVVASVNWWFR